MLFDLIKKWHKSIDYSILSCIFVMLLLSLTLVYSSSPAVAKMLQLKEDYFIHRQYIYIGMSSFVIIALSALNRDFLCKIGNFCTIFFIILLFAVAITGGEAKGAKRWLYFHGLSLEPSEILKPFLSITLAKILTSTMKNKKLACTMVYLLVICLLLIQPNFSMSVIVTSIWASQMFIFGISYIWLLLSVTSFLIVCALCYIFVPYMKNRILSFVDPLHNDTFQINKSIGAFRNGKIFGVGPGEGTVKLTIPDCHTDFVLAVAAEEFGIISCLGLLFLFGFIVAKGWQLAYKENDMFNLLVIAGLLTQFSSQFLINIGVVLNLLPTTGIALPMISYGGSSLLANSMLLGMLLCFSRYNMVGKRLSG